MSNKELRRIELLAPAKNLECGIAAIDHGADAVYIGAPRFGARAAAGNSIDDIATLCEYAHQFDAKVYVTVNTLLHDDELTEAQNLIVKLDGVGVDAFLIQDLRLLNSKLPVINSKLHASTQTDNRTVERVRQLCDMGFSRVVLARELSTSDIAKIHSAIPNVEIEVFVHGALCVAYSGICYASEYCFGRSANRGECAQFCRMKFNLKDSDDKVIVQDRYLLSLKDMCRIDDLEELLDAGAVSLKIEGRLKDVDYVKNVVAAYSIRLNKIIKKHPDKYQRASSGVCEYAFTPDLRKTFNRGYTDYLLHTNTAKDGFLEGRTNDIASPYTPKSLGEKVGVVKDIRREIIVAGTASFSNGDGLCFFNDKKELVGFRINRAEGNRLYPQRIPDGLKKGMTLYRNHDAAFEKLLSGKTATRKIPVTMTFSEIPNGFFLTLTKNDGSQATASLMIEKQLAQKNQKDNIIRQLTKLGNTPYHCTDISIEGDADKFFIPSSMLAEMRREVTARETSNRWSGESRLKFALSMPSRDGGRPKVNVERGTKYVEPLMQCRHCIRFSLGYCVRNGGSRPTWREPLYLELGDGRRFPLQFQCNKCQMNVYGEEMRSEEMRSKE